MSKFKYTDNGEEDAVIDVPVKRYQIIKSTMGKYFLHLKKCF